MTAPTPHKRSFHYLITVFALTVAIGHSADPGQSLPSPTPSASSTPSPAVPSGPPVSTIPSDKNFAHYYVMQATLADHMAANKPEDIDLIFIGDSITQAWRWGNGLPVWKRYYEGRAIDFGVSADRTEHVLWRLDNLGIRKFHPKVAVILIGTNNWDPTYTPEDIAEGVKAVIAKTRECFPGVKILLMSILPNARATEKMATANPLIRNLADGKEVIYVDLASKFTPEGENWKGLLKDKLHLTTEGYEMWAAEINPLIDQIAPKSAK